MMLTPGVLVGPYRVVEWLGAGGMGEVYRACDPRLDRDVAIKLLPERFASDPTRLRRFEQEARAAGQLNHPAILTVHDTGRHAGAPYVVSELLDGETLRARLRHGPLPVRTAVEYARHLADGLAAAHDKGIVHRDVKPENVFITADGRVKILDFGLAKLIHADPDPDERYPPERETITEPGTMLGSSGYMSPEQVRGERLDGRSDIFNLGTLLHEMVAGRPPFARGTPAEVCAAILRDEPEPVADRTGAALAGVISRCLEKNREARFQSARDLAFVLRDSPAIPAVVGPPSAKVRRVPVARAAAVVLIALLVGWTAWSAGRGPRSIEDRFADARITRFTDWDGTEGQAEISDDGSLVAFIGDRAGPFDVWTGEVGTGRFENLTAGRVKLSAPGPPMRLLQFSPDGSQLWIGGGPGAQSHLLSVATREMRPFLPVQSTGAAWSPDGARISFITVSDGDPLYVADAQAAGATPIFVREQAGLHTHNPVWSPDGQWLYFVHGRAGGTFEMDIWRVRPSGEQLEQLTRLKTALEFLAPIDEKTLLYVARAADRTGPWLWALDIPSRTTRRLVSGRDQFRSVAASRDGRRIVATVATPITSLAAITLADGIGDERDIREYAPVATPGRMPRFGGRSFFYVSAGGGAESVWRSGDGNLQEIWRGAEGTIAEAPAAAPNDARIAVVLHEGAVRRLWTMAADGTDRRVVPSFVAEGPAAWSPDATWIVAGGTYADVVGLYKIPADGGAPVRIVEGVAVNPIWSPDGELIVFNGPIVAGTHNLLAVRPDGTPVAAPPVRVRPGGQRFMRSGKRVVYQSSALDFHLLDLATGEDRPLTKFKSSAPPMAARTFDITPDETQLVFDRTRENSDIILIDLPR